MRDARSHAWNCDAWAFASLECPDVRLEKDLTDSHDILLSRLCFYCIALSSIVKFVQRRFLQLHVLTSSSSQAILCVRRWRKRSSYIRDTLVGVKIRGFFQFGNTTSSLHTKVIKPIWPQRSMIKPRLRLIVRTCKLTNTKQKHSRAQNAAGVHMLAYLLSLPSMVFDGANSTFVC